jgi:transposase-like protein
MKHDREFWSRHVRAWRDSGLTQARYCRRHRLTRGTLGYWASALRRSESVEEPLVEVGHTDVTHQRPSSAIELGVEGGRYLLRLWPGVDPAHLREVLSVLECHS